MNRLQCVLLLFTTWCYCEGSPYNYEFSWLPNMQDFSSVYDLYSYCSNDTGITLEDCFKHEVVTLLDQAVSVKNVTISEGVTLVGNSVDSSNNTDKDEDVTFTGRSNDEVTSNFLGVVARKIKNFVKSHSTVSVSLGEGRRRNNRPKLKLKRMMLPFLVGVVMKVASFLPVIFGIMTILGLHAFFTSKTALAIVIMMGLRSLMKKKHYSHHSTHHQDPYLYHHHGGGEPIAAIQRKSTGEVKHIIFLQK